MTIECAHSRGGLQDAMVGCPQCMADEIERLRAIENAALRLAGTFVKRNSTVDPVAMHKLDFALENHGAAHEPETRT